MTASPRILLLLAVYSALAACSKTEVTPANDANLFRVVREDLPITVKEAGELQAVRETIVRSGVEGQATIIYLVPEGTNVKEGEKLVELDVSDLVEKRANQEISVEKARSARDQARAQLDILEKELTTKRNTAASRLRIAQMELERLFGARGGSGSEGKNGDMVRRLRELIETPVQGANPENAGETGTSPARLVDRVDPRRHADLIDKAIALLLTDPEEDPLQRDMGDIANRILQQADQIRLAMAELKNKEDTASFSRRLAEKQFITRNELDRDELSYQSQLSRVTLAWNDLDLLVNYGLQRDRIQMMQDFDNAKLELERVEASNDAERKKSQFDIEAKEKELTVATERLANLNKQITNAVCYAPNPGLVVYARVDRDRRGGEAVREGLQVRERQELIILPDNTKMRCMVKVQEAQVDKVMRGQLAHISVEAFPNEVLTGKVTRVAPVADSSSSWSGNDKKVYTTIIDIDGENHDSRLRSRMAAAATVTIATVPNTLTVPQQAVRRDRSINYIWKQTPTGPVAVQVKVGSHNQEKVEILEGVAAGDVVYRTPPGGVPDPKFDQPVLPQGVDSSGTGTPAAGNPAAPPQPAADSPEAGRRAEGAGPGTAGASGPGGRNPGAAGAMNKKLTEMTPEEVQQTKERTLASAERLRGMLGEEQAATYENLVQEMVKAIDANDLETAQKHRDSMRSLMPRRAPQSGGEAGQGGGRQGGGGPGGGGGRER